MKAGRRRALLGALLTAGAPPGLAAELPPSAAPPALEAPAAPHRDAPLAGEDLLAAIRESAANLKPQYRQRLPAGDAAGQRDLLDRLAHGGPPPTAGDLARLFASLDAQLDALGTAAAFKAQVYAPDGRAAEREVIRLGAFGFIADGRYLVYSPEVDRLVELSRQPGFGLRALALDFAKTDSRSLAPVALDPSGGEILPLLVQIPDLGERIGQGGAVGYLILALAGFAFLLGGYRYAELAVTERRVQRQLRAPELRPDNPLGRILSRLEAARSDDEEVLYLTVQEALAGEQVKLGRALAFLKLVAAIAPMLGLLGTVTGMIKTFQAIALHGSGDPKLMSGGISEALVTTVEGLVTSNCRGWHVLFGFCRRSNWCTSRLRSDWACSQGRAAPAGADKMLWAGYSWSLIFTT